MTAETRPPDSPFGPGDTNVLSAHIVFYSSPSPLALRSRSADVQDQQNLKPQGTQGVVRDHNSSFSLQGGGGRVAKAAVRVLYTG